MTERVRVAVIGTGRAGMIHARNLKKNISYAELVALCDPSEEARQQAQEELDVAYLYADYKEVLENPNVDAVVIVTPTATHKEIVLAAAKNKKHVLCEKPLGMNEVECDEMIKACDKNNVKLQVGFMRRFDESFQMAKEIIDSGEIGDVVSVKSLTHGPSEPKPWMYDIKISSGPIGEVNSHDLDTVRWFTGSEVHHLYAVGGNFRSPEVKTQYPDYYDTVILNLFFDNEMIAAIEGAQYVQYGYDARVEILGTHGSISIGEQHKNKVVVARKNKEIVRPAMHSWTYLFKDAYVREDQDFIMSIIENRSPLVTGMDGRQAVQLVDMGLCSLLENRIVERSERI